MPPRRKVLRTVALLNGIGILSGCLIDPTDVGNPEPDAPGDEASPTLPGEQVQKYERTIHERVNEIREREELDHLAYNQEIAAVARAHSDDMAERGYFSHVSPEGDGPDDRMDQFFPEDCRGIGENIASVGHRPADDADSVAERIVSGWMDSPGHRENILRESFDEEGIGVAITDERVLATQNFCASASLVSRIHIDG